MPAKDSKARILYIYKMLVEQTDDAHYLTAQQIMGQLKALGIDTHRKTVIDDIEQLIEAGVEISCVKSTQNRYRIKRRYFEVSELKMLADAVAASNFITQEQSDALIGKLSEMAGKNNSYKLNRQVVTERVKTSNEDFFINIDVIHEAIHGKRQLSFKYFEYDAEKNRIYRNDGEVYRVSPYAVAWEDNRYYLIAHSLKHGKVVTYRVDRITEAEVQEFPAVPPSEDFSAGTYIKRAFKMYDNEKPVIVKLKCRNSVMTQLIDRFGIDVKTKNIDSEYFMAEVEVYASKMFYGWVFQSDGGVKITAPKKIRDEYENMLKNAI